MRYTFPRRFFLAISLTSLLLLINQLHQLFIIIILSTSSTLILHPPIGRALNPILISIYSQYSE